MRTAALFLDNNDMINSFGEQAGIRFDYEKYVKLLEDNFDLKKRNIYITQGKNNVDRFSDFVRTLGFDSFIRPARYYRVGSQTVYHPVWQVGLTLDVVQMLAEGGVDAIVLGVSNPAYVPLVDYIASAGVKVYVTAAKYHIAFDGKANLVDMGEYISSCDLKDGTPRVEEPVVQTTPLTK